MYLLLCISVTIRVVYRERAWLLGQALSLYKERSSFLGQASSLYKERAWPLGSGMVLVQRKGMAYLFRHGLFTPFNPPQLCSLFSTVWVLTMITVCQASSVLFQWHSSFLGGCYFSSDETLCSLYFLQC